MALGNQRHDVVHHSVQVPVLGRVHGGDAGLAQGLSVRRGDDPPDDHRDVADARVAQPVHDRGDELPV